MSRKRSELVCDVGGCDRIHYGKGLCQLHYQRAYKHGDPLTVRTCEKTIEQQFAQHTRKMDSGCVEWVGATDQKGYGQLRINLRLRRAHRVAWELVHGEIPIGILVCHHCDNPPCVNVDHLFIGSAKDNTADMSRKNRQVARFELAREAQNRKFTSEQIAEIRKTYGERKYSQVELAKRYGTTQGHISNIITWRAWYNEGA